MSSMHRRRLAAGLAALLWLASLAACGQVFLDPGPNPARVQVKLRAQAPEALLHDPGEPVYWDWGLYLVDSGRLTRLKPASPQQFLVIGGVNPLVRDTVFLAPHGQRTLRLLVTGYVFRSRSEGLAPVTLLNISRDYKLSLAPGGSHTIGLP